MAYKYYFTRPIIWHNLIHSQGHKISTNDTKVRTIKGIKWNKDDVLRYKHKLLLQA
jgi:hypothetical protein